MIPIAPMVGTPPSYLGFNDSEVPTGIRMRTAYEGTQNRGEMPGWEQASHVGSQTAPNQVVETDLYFVVDRKGCRMLGIED
jgi:hypothetical protein